MSRRDHVRIRHALDAIQKAILYLDDCTEVEFRSDELRQLAVVRLLEIIGEAANGVSPDFRKRFEDVPWRNMIAMRNRLIDGDFDVDDKIVWDTVKSELPPVARVLTVILQNDSGTD